MKKNQKKMTTYKKKIKKIKLKKKKIKSQKILNLQKTQKIQ